MDYGVMMIEEESKAGLVPHGFVVGKKREEKKREMERTRSRVVKMSGWNDSKLSILYESDIRYD